MQLLLGMGGEVSTSAHLLAFMSFCQMLRNLPPTCRLSLMSCHFNGASLPNGT